MSRNRWFFLLLMCQVGVCLQGCSPAPDIVYAEPKSWAELPPELKTAAAQQLLANSGTFVEPHVVIAKDVSPERLKHGQAVYQLRCVQCHGENGDGQGPVASHMYPRPRDYQKGIFKFTSTSYGMKPLRSDLVRIVRNGVRGTSMPAFDLLPQEDVDAVVDYVLSLTNRGELSDVLAYLADAEGELSDEIVQTEGVEPLIEKWSTARDSVILPTMPEPELTAERAERGRALFLSDSVGCLKCHGADGRGKTAENLAGNLRDKWGNPTRAADLTSGMLRGGQEPIDVYRRIAGGINGTPMPAFANAFADNPDAIWDLVAYVKFITNRRRAGESPDPGLIKPFIPAESGDAAEPPAAEE